MTLSNKHRSSVQGRVTEDPAVAEDPLETVLLADANDDRRRYLAELLQEENYATAEVNQGSKALHHLRDVKIAAAVVDGDLADMTALELVRAGRRACVPVIVHSAAGNVRDAVAAMKAGAWHYLGGPIVRRELVETLAAAVAARHDWVKRREGQRQAKKAADFAMLARRAVHAFSDMLVMIIGYSELLGFDSPHDSVAAFYASQINHAGRRAFSSSHELLVVGREPCPEIYDLDLNPTVQRLERLLRPLFRESIDIVTCLEPRLGLVRADPIQIDQLLIDVLLNARDAMAKDGDRLTIATCNFTLDQPRPQYPGVPPGEYVLLSVADTGCGMDEHVRSRLFEPYFTTKEHGTGLGLIAVDTIARRFGGYVAVDSAPKAGTTFTILLPCVQDKERGGG
jgi:signal transduction histidine kinase